MGNLKTDVGLQMTENRFQMTDVRGQRILNSACDELSRAEVGMRKSE
ncbi:hypothetical protein D1BOALGB6SA_1152 [Olavius sp. associated proteobacterium Delta 1]|nr:hypothetical protein D1BOALGB6SA_1152 [Olavius sp. associated proteobacterium Delta 1]